jgi:hypothetical protein
VRTAVIALFALFAFTSPAFASSVTTPNVDNTVPSAAAGARTVYKVSFATVSGPLTLSDTVTVTLPAGTGTDDWQGGTMRDTTRGVDAGFCNVTALTVTCSLFSNQNIPAGNQVLLTLRGVTNPTGSPQTLSVVTSDDTAPANSNPYAIQAAAQVTRPTVTINSPSAGTRARTRYIATFNVSGVGGLSAEAGSEISVSLAADVDPGTWQGGTVHDVTRNVDVGFCNKPDAGLVSTCGLFSNSFVNPNDQLQVILRGLTNSNVAGQANLRVSTTSDLPQVSSDLYTVVAGSQVSTPTVSIANPSSATGAQTRYVVTFNVSEATGGMSSDAGSQMTVTLPPDTGTDGWQGGTVHDVTRNVDVGTCGEPDANRVSTCGFFSNSFVNAGDQLQLTLRGLTNGPAGSGKQVSVSTTSDVPTVSSGGFTIDPRQQLTKPTVSIANPSPATGARTRYVVTFSVSTSGGMSAEAGSQMTVTLPQGTGTTGWQGGTVHDVSRNVDVGTCGQPDANRVSTCGFFSNSFVNGGDQLQLTLRGLTNGPAGNDKTVSVTSTSDLDSPPSDPFTVVPAHALSKPTVSIGDPSPAAGARTRYVVNFAVSNTGGMSAEAGSQMTVTLPQGTGRTAWQGGTVHDVTRNVDVGTCGQPNASLVSTCGFFSNSFVNGGDQLQLILRGLTNGAAGSGKTVSVTSTSDLDSPASDPFTIADGQQISAPTVAIDNPSPASGARTRYLVNFRLSSTGGMSAEAGSQMTVTLPAGTGGTGWNGGTVHDVTRNVDVGTCTNPATGLISTCGFFSNSFVNAGDELQLILRGLTNGAAGGGKQVTVSTTSDTPTVTSDPFTIAGSQALTDVSATLATTSVVRLKTSSTGGLSAEAAGQITLTFPANTTFPSYQSATVYDLDRAVNVGTCQTPVSATVRCGFFSNSFVNSGDRLQISFTTPINSPGNTVTAATTSDTATTGPTAPGDTTPPDTTLNSGGPPFTFSSEAGATFECRIDTGAWAACTSPYTPPPVAGTHRFWVRAVDGAGNRDLDPPSTQFTGTQELDTTITSGPSGPTNDPTFAFTGNGVGFQCVVDDGDPFDCDSPYTVAAGQGPHTFSVQAVDASGAADQTPATRSFTLDTTPPAAPTVNAPTGTDSATPTFTFSGDPGTTFACSLDGGGFSGCSSPYTTPALTSGEHALRVRSTDGAGNATTSTRTFTVSVPQQATPTPTATAVPTTAPTPTPTATATPTPTPTPVANKTVVVAPVKGTVKVCKSPGVKCVDLPADQAIANGATIDTKKGSVELTSIPKPGAPPEHATFHGGIFKIDQRRGITNLTLNEPLASCTKAKKSSAHASAKHKKKKKKPKSRRLFGSGKGSFRTTGRYSAATIRGTAWSVTDSCSGTRTKVTQGVVSVRDKVKKHTFLVKAGKSYLAKPKKKKRRH